MGGGIDGDGAPPPRYPSCPQCGGVYVPDAAVQRLLAEIRAAPVGAGAGAAALAAGGLAGRTVGMGEGR